MGIRTVKNPIWKADGGPQSLSVATGLEILEIYDRKSCSVKFAELSGRSPFWLVLQGEYFSCAHNVLCWKVHTQSITTCER